MDPIDTLMSLSSSELAAWVQALGSIVAILGAAIIAIHQSKQQHLSALEVHQAEQRTAKAELANTLAVLASNAGKAMKFIGDQLKDRQSVYDAAEGLAHCDIGEIGRINSYIEAIPLHSVPDSLVTQTMILGSTVRQFKEKVTNALAVHRKMDAEMFNDFFKSLNAMNVSVQLTCKDIEAEAKKLREAATSVSTL